MYQLLIHIQYVSFPSHVMRFGGLGVGLARPTVNRNRTRRTSATGAWGTTAYSKPLLPLLLEIIDSIDYHRAVGSGAVGHSGVIPMIQLLYKGPTMI